MPGEITANSDVTESTTTRTDHRHHRQFPAERRALLGRLLKG
jgi:hypothetical protein